MKIEHQAWACVFVEGDLRGCLLGSLVACAQPNKDTVVQNEMHSHRENMKFTAASTSKSPLSAL